MKDSEINDSLYVCNVIINQLNNDLVMQSGEPVRDC
jgi:hypothetical protein